MVLPDFGLLGLILLILFALHLVTKEMAVHIFERERPQPSNEFDDETCECCGPYTKL